MIQAKITGEKVTSSSQEAFSLFEKSSLGEKKAGKVEYSLIEALYLLTEDKMQIFSSGKPLSEESLTKKIKKYDKKIETKLIVFKDLRKKGYVLKTALKFGADFRVYNKGSKPGQSHAPWLVYISQQNNPFNWQEFAAKNRIAHSTNKKLMIALVDEESDVSYYQVEWMRP